MASVRIVSNVEASYWCSNMESQIFDRKSSRIKPAKLSESLSALANSDGGELVIGIEDDGTWSGFNDIEDTNDIVALAARIMRSDFYAVEHVRNADKPGIAVVFTIDRHPNIILTESGDAYTRQAAANIRMTGESLEVLKRSKGESRYESTRTDAPVSELENSEVMIDFMINGRAFSEPSEFLLKNRLVESGNGTVAGTTMFADLPQAHIPYAAIKLYRYKTSGDEDRDHLDGIPETIEGPIIHLITETKRRVQQIIAAIPKLEDEGFVNVAYPPETLHEILVNALLHRDYGIRDYVHVRIFDNRIEIDSPGRLHGHVTVENILDERSFRNPLLQRIVNKFPEPPNMDIGEGLNTAFRAMEKSRLRYPTIQELSDRVRVTISHEPLASPEAAIMDYAVKNGSINNSEAQGATKIQQERTMRRYFESLVNSGQLRREGSGRGTRYFPTEAADGKSHETTP